MRTLASAAGPFVSCRVLSCRVRYDEDDEFGYDEKLFRHGYKSIFKHEHLNGWCGGAGGASSTGPPTSGASTASASPTPNPTPAAAAGKVQLETRTRVVSIEQNAGGVTVSTEGGDVFRAECVKTMSNGPCQARPSLLWVSNHEAARV